MDFTIEEWVRKVPTRLLGEAAALWNANAEGRHAFFPWSADLLQTTLHPDGNLAGRFLAARRGDELAGFAHVYLMEEYGYPRVGSVEMILVDKRFRNRGLGAMLLARAIAVLEGFRPQPEFLDALGAWPFGFVYNVLADGSERSGVFLREAELYRLFQRAGFEPVRRSLVMRAALPAATPAPAVPDAQFHVLRRTEGSWLDRVFRGRELWDHFMVDPGMRILSRAIFGLMDGESRREGRAIFSLFGVNTPEEYRRRGYAAANLSHLMEYIAAAGGRELELHVYADNLPALGLYRSLGFREVAETMMMHRKLR